MIFASLSLLSAAIVETVRIKNSTNMSSNLLWFITMAPQHIFIGASVVFVIPAGISFYDWIKNEFFLITEQTIICSKLIIETLKKV